MSAPEPARPPLPPDEQARLAELRGLHVLDTPPEAEFDDVALLAARLCGTPIALMSLVDAERQWFKARVGLDVKETPRDMAFCAHAVAERGLLEVPDAAADPRFARNPLVQGDPKIRFYAGAPLLTPRGHALGTLCVIDRVPRRLSDEQRAALRILSRHIAVCLELRRQAVELREAQAALAREHEFAQATVDALSSNIAIVDAQGTILATNRAWREFARANGAEPSRVGEGSNYLAACAAAAARGCAEAAAFAEGVRAVLRGERELFTLEYACHSTSERRFFTGRVTRFAGEGRAVAVAHENITTRRLAEDQLRGFNERLERTVAERTGELVAANRELSLEIEERARAEAKLRHGEAYHRTLIENGFDGIAVVDRQGRILDVSPAIEGILGYPGGHLRGRDCFELVQEDDAREAREDLGRLAQQLGAAWRSELRFRHQDGTLRVVEARAVNLADNPVVGGILVSFRDITQRRRAEAAQRELARRLLSAQEEERRRIARELHDEIGQALTAVKVGLQTTARRLDDAPARARLDASLETIDATLEEVRRLALDLRPSILDDLGLAAALRWYTERNLRDAPFAVELSVELPERLPAEVETACFRVVQEALTNVLRHARCRRVVVEAHETEGSVEVAVRDDGVGFDPEAGADEGGGMGLSGMRERVGLVQGRLEVRAAPGAGTEVRARIPKSGSARR